MAKKSKTGGRGITTNSTPTARYNLPRPTVPVIVTLLKDTPLSDRRTWGPDKSIRPPAALNRNATRIVAADKLGDTIRRQTKATLRFRVPEQVAICARRKRRKEVLFAKRKAGKTGQRKPRRNFWSSISCKR